MLPGWCGTGAAAFPGKVNPLLLLHQEGGLGKLLGAAGKAILEISRRLIAVGQTRGPWEPCRVGASTPHPRRAGGPQDQHIGPRGAGTEQKVLQCQHKISKEPCLLQGWLRKSTEDHGPPRSAAGTAPAQPVPTAPRERVDAVAAHRGWAAAGCARGSRCDRFGARCYLLHGVGCSPVDAGRGPGYESTSVRVGLVPSATKASLERVCWWGWGRSRCSCSPLGEGIWILGQDLTL